MGRPREEDLQIAREFKAKLAARIKILGFKLFGSRARGTASWDSDLDLYIEVESLSREEEEFVNNLAFETSLDKGVVIAPVVFTRKEVEKTFFKITPFYRAVQEEGISL